MTTQVTILNHGPYRIAVRKCGSDLADGRPGDVSKEEPTIVSPGAHHVEHLHQNQQLVLGELPNLVPVPTEEKKDA